MTSPRGLSPEEAAVWRRVTATVKPLAGKAPAPRPAEPEPGRAAATGLETAGTPLPQPSPPPGAQVGDGRERAREPRPLTRDGLDRSWERRLAQARAAPELTIDLHGLNLDQAHSRVVAGLSQAIALGARVVLVVAGKPRPLADDGAAVFAGRGERRGAIRAKLLDWLAASEHAPHIAAVRPAHPRHGGAGAVYVILRRRR